MPQVRIELSIRIIKLELYLLLNPSINIYAIDYLSDITLINI